MSLNSWLRRVLNFGMASKSHAGKSGKSGMSRPETGPGVQKDPCSPQELRELEDIKTRLSTLKQDTEKMLEVDATLRIEGIVNLRETGPGDGIEQDEHDLILHAIKEATGKSILDHIIEETFTDEGPPKKSTE